MTCDFCDLDKGVHRPGCPATMGDSADLRAQLDAATRTIERQRVVIDEIEYAHGLSVKSWCEAVAQRDELAGLLRESTSSVAEMTGWIKRKDAALARIKP